MKRKFHSTAIKIITVFSLLLITFSVNAQEVKIYELFDDTPQQKKSLNSRVTKSLEANKLPQDNLAKFYNLHKKVHPTVYVAGNGVKNRAGKSKPVKLTIKDVFSLNKLGNNNSLYNSVELLTINLENPSDLNRVLDLSKFQNLNNLKYIFIQSPFKISVNQIRNFIRNAGPEITIYFMMIKPS